MGQPRFTLLAGKKCIRSQEFKSMLLVIDVGNTNTVLGVFSRVAGAEGDAAPRDGQLVANWRVATSRTSTVDELVDQHLRNHFLDHAGKKAKELRASAMQISQ